MIKAHKIWELRALLKQIWVRVTLFSLLGLVTALCGLWFNRYVPSDWADLVGADAVDSILTILASSMLAVTTFSLNTMLGAYNSVSTNVTPRATQLLIHDQTTQNVLSSFVGAFVFSIVGIISLQAGVYGNRGKVVIFAVTLVVVVVVVIALLRWINHLMQFGRFGEAAQRVENITAKALKKQAQRPCEKAYILPLDWKVPVQATTVFGPTNGYLQHIDVEALAELCSEPNQRVFCVTQPGEFITTGTVIAYSLGLKREQNDAIHDAFVLAVDRSFEQDPRFGLRTLSEIASRALSSAVNDPGTAINIITRGTRLLANYSDHLQKTQDTNQKASDYQVFMMQPTNEELFDEFFTPIARDGAALIEVMLALVTALEQLIKINPDAYGDLVKQHIHWLVERASLDMSLVHDKARLRARADELFEKTG